MRLFPIVVASAAAAYSFPSSPQRLLSSTVFDSLDDVVSASPLLAFHRDMIQAESITGNEHNVGSLIVDFLESRNFTIVKQYLSSSHGSGGESRFNIYAHPTSNHSPKILLTSHIDTVPPFIPYSVSEDSGFDSDASSIRIHGRGSVDAKGCVAAQVFAALETLDDEPTSPIGLLFVVGEETGGDGMRYFSSSALNTSPPSFHTVIFGEPTELALVSGHKGLLGFDIVASGQAAHSGYPWLGRSAISAILPALSRLDKLGAIPVSEGGLPSSPKYGNTTINIGRIDAGVATNVIPAFARAGVALRLAAGTPEEARRLVTQAIHDATGGDENVYVDFSGYTEAYPPQDLDTDVDGFPVITVNYGTDVPNLRTHNGDPPIKRYLYGPGSIHVAHGDHEAITADQLEESVRGYRKLIAAGINRG